MSTTKVTLPQLGESIHEGTIGKWLKGVGEPVEEFEPIVEILTDKVNAEVPSPIAGKISAILVKEGETVEVGTIIAEMVAIGAEVALAAASPAPQQTQQMASAFTAPTQPAPAPVAAGNDANDASFPNGRASGGWYDEDEEDTFAGAVPAVAAAPVADGKKPHRYSPAVRRLAEEHQLDLSRVAIRGSGMGGRITRDDIIMYVESQRRLQQPMPTRALPYEATSSQLRATSQTPAPAPQQPPMHDQIAANVERAASYEPRAISQEAVSQAPIPVQPAPMQQAPAPVPANHQSSIINSQLPDGDYVPLTPMRRSIAEHMVRSVQTSPHAWTLVEVDMTRLVRWRAQNKESFKAREGVDLTFMPFFMKAVVDGLRQFPALNASWSPDGNGILMKRDINLGVAIDVPDGLVVPVIRNAEEKSLVGLARSLNDLVARGRNRKLTLQDLQGGTFTVNNPGAFGSVMSQPIINQPQAAIVTMESIVKRPAVVTDADGNDNVLVRSMMNVCISFDHRVVDGATAGRFLQAVKKWLETRDYNAGF